VDRHPRAGGLRPKNGGVTFNVLTHSCIKHALGRAALDEEQGYLLPAILAFVLQSETSDQEHPGRFVDYLDNTDFKFEIVGDGEHFDIVADATTRLHS
jgi:hypothetical protein